MQGLFRQQHSHGATIPWFSSGKQCSWTGNGMAALLWCRLWRPALCRRRGSGLSYDGIWNGRSYGAWWGTLHQSFPKQAHPENSKSFCGRILVRRTSGSEYFHRWYFQSGAFGCPEKLSTEEKILQAEIRRVCKPAGAKSGNAGGADENPPPYPQRICQGEDAPSCIPYLISGSDAGKQWEHLCQPRPPFPWNRKRL